MAANPSPSATSTDLGAPVESTTIPAAPSGTTETTEVTTEATETTAHHPRRQRASPRGAAPTVEADPPGSRRDAWMAAAIGGLALLVYVRSLLPGIGYSGDTAKWQMLSQVGGVPHATGYPLYVALIQAFQAVVPFGSAAWRTNLFSAVAGAGTVAVLFLLLRALGVRRAVAASAALTFAGTKLFWIHSEIAEVYTLHLLLMAGVFLCLTRWRTGGGNRWLMAGVGLLMLSFGNHMTTALAVPGVVWIIWSDRQRAFTAANALWTLLVGLLGASQYLYLLRMADVGGYVELPADNLGDLVSIVTGGAYKDQMLVFTVRQLVQERIPLVWELFREEYLVLLIPAGFGLWQARRLDKPRRHAVIGLALLGLGAAFYGMNYDVRDVEVFFLPSLMVAAVFLGIGLQGLLDRVTDKVADTSGLARNRQVARLAVAGTLAAIPLVMGVVNYSQASQRGSVALRDRTEAALDAIGQDAVLITDNYDDSSYFWYYLIGEGLDAERNVSLVHGVDPDEVEAYFAGQPGPVTDAAARVGAGTPGAQPPIYTASPYQPEELEDAGLETTEVAPQVWRVEPGSDRD